MSPIFCDTQVQHCRAQVIWLRQTLPFIQTFKSITQPPELVFPILHVLDDSIFRGHTSEILFSFSVPMHHNMKLII